MRNSITVLAALVAVSGIGLSRLAQAQYTVEPEGSPIRGHLWIGEGIADVFSADRSLGHRFRLGGDLQFGDDHQYDLGMTFFDRIGSGERSASVGDISRRATDFNFGYFFVPDRFWLMYSLLVQDLSGSEIIGSVTSIGHQFSVGYRFWSSGSFNLALEAAFSHVPSYEASTFDFTTNTSGSASFPQANIWSLNLRVGIDLGGG